MKLGWYESGARREFFYDEPRARLVRGILYGAILSFILAALCLIIVLEGLTWV